MYMYIYVAWLKRCLFLFGFNNYLVDYDSRCRIATEKKKKKL